MSKAADSNDRVLFLRLGADGMLSSEANPDEVQLTIKNALDRQAKGKGTVTKPVVNTINGEITQERFKEKNVLEMNEKNLSVVINNDHEISLTKLEYQVMRLLSSKPNEAFSYQQIFEYLWNKPYNDEKYRVSNLIFHLRNKIEKDLSRPRFLITVRSMGYLLRVETFDTSNKHADSVE